MLPGRSHVANACGATAAVACLQRSVAFQHRLRFLTAASPALISRCLAVLQRGVPSDVVDGVDGIDAITELML